MTLELRSKQETILSKIGKELEENNYTFQQFNGRFGGKSNTYVDSVRTQFIDFEDFYAQWLKGLIDKYETARNYQLDKYGRTYKDDSSAFRNYRLIQDKEIRDFVQIFLERNFYKRLHERTRSKPSENLWSIWFGYQLTYGLLISPVKRDGHWTNDKSEIRRAEYSYWTIGHVLTEGFVDPLLGKPYKFKSLDELIVFYQSILKRLSVSVYEHAFYDMYIDYLKKSKNVEEEPLLIPEIRYAGLEKKHIHRLDFTILNVHTSEYTGFELSPASTHMSVANLKEKQYKVNEELSEKWGKEMQKRNDYFKDFNITIITFTDSTLQSIVECFQVVKEKLIARKINKVSLKAQLERL